MEYLAAMKRATCIAVDLIGIMLSNGKTQTSHIYKIQNQAK